MYIFQASFARARRNLKEAHGNSPNTADEGARGTIWKVGEILVYRAIILYAKIELFTKYLNISIFNRETKTMKETQARTSVETAREVNNDKSLKSKAEKDRILREKNSNMTKWVILMAI